MVSGKCHCGAVSFEVDAPPKEVGVCNGSLCSKIGWIVAYYHPSQFRLGASHDTLETYIWGDKTLQTCRCKTCGCATHWESIDPKFTERMGVNARLFEGIDLEKIPVRKIDGASY